MIVSAIVAMGKNRVIGKDNKLLWRLPEELKLFKETTMGHHMIMGRKTFESTKVLPGRTSIVVTRNKNYRAPDGVFVANSVDDALKIAESRGENEVFITGGEEIFFLSMPLLQKLYLTEVNFEEDGDAFFPPLVTKHWNLISEKHMDVSEKNPYAWTHKIYLKK